MRFLRWFSESDEHSSEPCLMFYWHFSLSYCPFVTIFCVIFLSISRQEFLISFSFIFNYFFNISVPCSYFFFLPCHFFLPRLSMMAQFRMNWRILHLSFHFLLFELDYLVCVYGTSLYWRFWKGLPRRWISYTEILFPLMPSSSHGNNPT
jgi:hypothetical protein